MQSDDGQKRKSPAVREEGILRFWRENKVFEKSLQKSSPNGEFVFYDGPPFATGLPHYGHILAGTIKDVIPRYKTMRGYHVPRRWGWDCHGLPVENEVEKELGLATKKDIERFGLEKFNERAREAVMRYADEWRRQVPRFGRFVDMDKDYRTMDASYTESVWWVFKMLHEKGLIYEGRKSMHLCPRCETTLSNFEVAQGYKEVKDIAVYVKFRLLGEKNTYLLAWTTTPWTLPGNVALAVHPDADYLVIEHGPIEGEPPPNVPAGKYIVAKEALKHLVKIGEFDEIIPDYGRYFRAQTIPEYSKPVAIEELVGVHKVMKGKELVGMSYQPLFDYYQGSTFEDPHGRTLEKETGWKIYAADFVKTDEGTGIVHVAPAFGDDDYQLAQKEKLPFVQHVDASGHLKKEVRDFAGLPVKPKGNPRETDEKIAALLESQGLLFAKEDITHSYPFCWRCETPLLNYAASSWFLKVTAIKDQLISENKKIMWVPPEVGTYRFGNWLKEAKDWAISRSRFWGAPIPVWRCEECHSLRVIGSIAELKDGIPRSGNRYFLMRHGEADNNVLGIMSSEPSNPHHLTERGREQVRRAIVSLAGTRIDYIFASPFLRTQETAAMVAEALRVPAGHLVTDERIRELRAGSFNGKPAREYGVYFSKPEERFTKAPSGGETYAQIKERMGRFLYDLEARFRGKNILIITHDAPTWMLLSAAEGFTRREAVTFRGQDDFLIKNAEVREIPFVPLPHNAEFELDLHRPSMDTVTFLCNSCGGVMRRMPEVFDCWFESGSMPYAEQHYLGKPLAHFDPRGGFFRRSKGFPADFIAEGVDQTRGWFYSLLVLGVALFGRSPYRRVVVNGTVLAEDGQKMSKRLKNYPDPMEVVDKYGADALRYYLVSSPAIKAEELRFSERGVDEVVKRVLNRLDNVLAFFKLYDNGKMREFSIFNFQFSKHILDRWIVVRLNQLVTEVTEALERYELDKATRPIAEFVDDLSTWYLRRSRERIKQITNQSEDATAALATLRHVLLELSRVMAPFTPFFAEYLYQSLTSQISNLKESVHLEGWPDIPRPPLAASRLLDDMAEVRQIVSLALEARSRAGVKVRQPLQTLKVKSQKLTARDELLALIADEVNVKAVVVDAEISSDVELDSTITPSLKEEGELRELIRAIQDLRKKKGLRPIEEVTLVVSAEGSDRAFIERHVPMLKKAVRLRDILFGDGGGVVAIEGTTISISLK